MVFPNLETPSVGMKKKLRYPASATSSARDLMTAERGRGGNSLRLPSDNFSTPTNDERKIRTHFHFWGIQKKSNLRKLGLVVNATCHAAFCKRGKSFVFALDYLCVYVNTEPGFRFAKCNSLEGKAELLKEVLPVIDLH